MTITAQTSKTGPYTGNGTTTVFSYTFEVQDEAHLVVTLTDAAGLETVQVLNTDYTVSGVGNANGGQITMTTAPASTYTLTISRDVPITQEVDLENRRSVAPEVLEDAYDKLTQIAQDLNEQVSRAIKTSISTASPADLPATDRVGKYLAFDAAGDPTYASGTGSDAALRADLATAGASTGAALVAYTAGTGATARTVQSRLQERVSVKDFGAVCDDVTDDTVAIQAAINYVHAAGGGEVVIDGNTVVSLSAEPDTFLKVNAPPTPSSTSLASAVACLVLRSGVTLVLQDGARITSSNTTPTVIVAVDMDGGGVVGRGKAGRITSNWTASGAGHGILLSISADGQDNINLTFDNLEIYQVGSYGIGAQYGDYANNRYSNLYIHDTGADGIDHKVRNGSENISRGVTFENIVVERQGRRTGITASAGIDVRGPATLNNIWVLNYALGTQNNVGIRLSSATYDPESTRETSSYSSLTNFYIDGGDPSISGTEGVTLLSSQGSQVGFGTVRNCRASGLKVSNAASGVGDVSKLVNLAMITIEGCRASAASVLSEGVNLVGVRVIGQVDPFSQIRGNLVIGQTVLDTPRPHSLAAVQVWKNGTQLTVTTDYVVTDVDTITLVVAAVDGDVFEVITPTTVGFDIDRADCATSMCSTEHVTTPESVAGAAVGTYRPGPNSFGNGDIYLRGGTDPHIGVAGLAADYELDLRGRGTGGVTLRSGTGRALRASNPASPVNWVQVSGSATGQPVILKPAGTDTNIDVEVTAKNSGVAALGGGASARQVQANATGIGFYGTTPIAKPTGVAVSAAGIHAALVSLGLIAP